jgi:2-polyprenyl-6-methoxyphenol hydroxylase-like FAD-dependent oxidoreductase
MAAIREPETLVVGAGPTGLTMAVELARASVPFRIVEKSTEPAQHSQALVIQARTLEQLDRYGLAAQFVDRGRPLHSVAIFDRRRKVASLAFDSIPSRHPYVLLLPQAETERLLIDHLASLGTEIERGTEVTAVRRRDDSVEVELRDQGGQSERLLTRWLIGCDGVHSSVREAMAIPFRGEQVGQLFQLADLELRGKDRPTHELRVYLQHGELVFIGPLAEDVFRLIAVNYPREEDDEERTFELDDFQAALGRCVSDDLEAASPRWLSRFHVQERTADRYRKGNVFLAGDSCHVHAPVAGQGMNTGMQDAANLGWKLAAVRNGAPASLLDSYDAERRAVGEFVVRRTSRALSAALSGNTLLAGARDAMLALISVLPMLRAGAQNFISEIGIEYRDSPAVTDCLGDGELRAGDRMPDLELPLADGPRTRMSTLLQDGVPVVLLAESDGCHMTAPEGRARIERVATAVADATVTVVRPDGYIGFRGDSQHSAELATYARLVGT